MWAAVLYLCRKALAKGQKFNLRLLIYTIITKKDSLSQSIPQGEWLSHICKDSSVTAAVQ